MKSKIWPGHETETDQTCRNAYTSEPWTWQQNERITGRGHEPSDNLLQPRQLEIELAASADCQAVNQMPATGAAKVAKG